MCGDEAAAARSMLQISYPVCPHPARFYTSPRRARDFRSPDSQR
jgi:hypothetical protein